MRYIKVRRVGVFLKILWQKKMVPTPGNWGQKGLVHFTHRKHGWFVQYNENKRICENSLHTV